MFLPFHSLRLAFAALLFGCAGAALAAESCEDIRSRIEANIAGKGVTAFSVTVVDEAADVPGKVVGSCGNGSKKIVYARHGSAPPAQAAPSPAAPVAVGKPASPGAAKPKANQVILTECKDGTVSMGGDCKR